MLPSVGGCKVLRATRACTAGVATRGLLPLWRASSPAMRSFSKRFFQRQIVGPVVFSCDAIRSHVKPSARLRMIRARNTSPAGSVRDCAHRVSFVLSSAVTSSHFRYCPTSLRRTEAFFSYDRDSLLVGLRKVRRPENRQIYASPLLADQTSCCAGTFGSKPCPRVQPPDRDKCGSNGKQTRPTY